MGSDRSPIALFQAVELTVKAFPSLSLAVFVTQAALDEIIAVYSYDYLKRHGTIEFHITPDVIEMHDDPLLAIRHKKHSSIVLGIKLLKRRYLDALVTCGNTGAFIAASTLSLPLLPGVKRPALLATLPTAKGSVAIIDVGGSVSCKAHHLIQFAILGASYQCASKGIEKPRVGLLNIGAESGKGTAELRKAYQLLREMNENGEIVFAGNIEGREVFQGAVDVLVTDGFTGNVLLKSSEGVSLFLLQKLEKTLRQLLPEQHPSLMPILKQQFDYEEYSGAIVCGVDGVAIKSHGQSSPKTLFRSIEEAIRLLENNLIPQMKLQLGGSAPMSSN